MHSDLGDFLQSRRARIQPEEAGLREYGRRRVPGLRREEVAQLAGVSVDYYIRLEQGRGRNVSDSVLDAVANALRLNDSERRHLYALARPADTVVEGPRELRPGARLVLDAIAAPAFVLGRRMDVIAWNALGDAVSEFSKMPVSERNQARYLFLNPESRIFYPDWEPIAAETVAYLRRDTGRYLDDAKLAALVAELARRSPEFAQLWSGHPVKEKSHGDKVIHHPRVGRMEFGYETLSLAGDPDHTLVIYTALPGSVTAERLALLNELTSTSANSV